MKKLSLIVVLSLFVSVVLYGTDFWESYNPGAIRPKDAYDIDYVYVDGTISTKTFKMSNGAVGGYVLTCSSDGAASWQKRWSKSGSTVYYNDGKVGIGTSSPGSRFSVGGAGDPRYAIYGYHAVGVCGKSIPAGSYYEAIGVLGEGEDYGVKALAYAGSGNGIGVYSCGRKFDFYASSSSGKSYFAGKVGIGTGDPQSKLDVSGTITADEIEVQSDGLPDFVFEDNYKLMSLNNLEKHIKKEKSLPGIPSSEEAATNGVKLGDMQAKLLQKVEELTLYVIEQNKEIAELKERIAELEK